MTNKVRTVFANMSWMLIAQVITSVLAFAWTILIGRYLGPSEYGIFGTGVSFAALFAVLADLGIGSYIVRSISSDFNNECEYLSNAFSLSFLLSFFYLIVVLIVLFFLGWENYIVVICLLYAIETVIIKLASILAVSFQAHEQMKYSAFSNLITSVSTFILMLVIIFTPFKLLGVTFVFIFANILALIYNLWAVRKYFIKLKFSFDFEFYKTLILGGIPFAIGGVFYTIYYSIDIVMITQFVGTYETGLYNAAYKLISVFTLFYSIYGLVVYPVMIKLFKNSKDLLHTSFVKSMKYLLLVTVPIAVFTCFYSYDIIYIYGSEFIEAGAVLNILIWTVCFLFVNGACSMILNSSYKEYSVTKIFAVAAIFNIILNLFLIQYYSIYGAAIATVLSEILIFILEMYTIKKIDQLPDRHFVFDVFKIVLASGILTLVLYYLNLNLWLAMPVSIIVYFAVILLLKTPDDQDKLIIKQILNR